MSEANRPRRALAEIKWGADPNAIVWVGNRSLHQYWPLLSGYFRDILLPPQRRADETKVFWTWREPTESKPFSAAELAGIRKRLTTDHQLFVENLTRGLGGEHEDGGLRGQGNADELEAAVGGAIAQLIASSDSELATFVCRTEHGLRVHSWGAPVAAQPIFPDAQGGGISGHVFRGENAAARTEVILETERGDPVDQTETNPTGAFGFARVTAGKYRLRARSRKTGAIFPEKGVGVTVAGAPVSGLVLRETDEHPAPPGAGWRRAGWTAFAAAAIFLAAWGLWRWRSREAVVARGAERSAELNSSRANAPQAFGRRATARAATEPEQTLPVVAAPRRILPGEEPGARAMSVDTEVAIEREIVLPGTTLLPGEVAGTPAASPVAIAAGKAASSNRAAASGRSAHRPTATAASTGPGTSMPATQVPVSVASRADRDSREEPSKSAAPGATAHATERSRDETQPEEKMRVAAGAEGEKSPPLAGLVDPDDSTAAKHLDANDTSGDAATALASSMDAAAADDLSPNEMVQRVEAAPVAERGHRVQGAQRTWRVQRITWEAKVWRDAIATSLADEREGERAQPSELRGERIRTGLTISVPGEEGQALYWTNGEEGLAPTEKSGVFDLVALAMDEPQHGALMRQDGAVIAEWVSGERDILLHVAEGLSVQQWFILEATPGEQWAWRSASGGPLPRAASDDERVAIALDGARANGVSQSIAAIESESGWALIGHVRVDTVAELVP